MKSRLGIDDLVWLSAQAGPVLFLTKTLDGEMNVFDSMYLAIAYHSKTNTILKNGMTYRLQEDGKHIAILYPLLLDRTQDNIPINADTDYKDFVWFTYVYNQPHLYSTLGNALAIKYSEDGLKLQNIYFDEHGNCHTDKGIIWKLKVQ